MKQKSFSTWQFVLIVTVLSWPFQFWYVFNAATDFDKYLYSSLAMVMVAVATLIAGRYVFKDGFAGAGWSWGKPISYMIVLLFALLVWFVPGVIEIISGIHSPVTNETAANVLKLFALHFIATLIPAFGEEFGWRGYMLKRLAKKYGARKGLIAHSFIWWFWHLPVLIGIGLKSDDVSDNHLINVFAVAAISIIPSMLHAVIFAFIWAKTKSLAVVTIYHAAFDEVRDALEKSIGFGPLVNIWQMAVIVIAGVLLLYKVDWKNLLASN